MDEVIFEEFKGTGNMEMHIPSQAHRSPGVPVNRYSEERHQKRRAAHPEGRFESRLGAPQSAHPALTGRSHELPLSKMGKTRNNGEFLGSMSNGTRHVGLWAIGFGLWRSALRGLGPVEPEAESPMYNGCLSELVVKEGIHPKYHEVAGPVARAGPPGRLARRSGPAPGNLLFLHGAPEAD